MELEKFKDADRSELSMIEVAHEILKQHGDVMPFADLTNEVQEFLGKSDEEIRERLSQFYTDLNIDGSFISLGDNLWGLRSWYPYDSIDEAVVHIEDDEDEEHDKRRKVNAFMDDDDDGDDDVIDFDDDNDDQNFTDSDDDSEIKEYDKDLSDIDETDDVDDNELPDGIEGQLSELSDDDLDDQA
ncbi:DNA-directed RNA polymerase subunit delta [Liquorilactobacillus vini]|uniref:Probable DNA-directed RNA polymerase subunit delta n=1 Tax=Liquorilactobacillus vini DSM 20605 TaxID=1133569 RepID=A0A0R2CG32_9LACO|nr:DNA-directed RNA polymerase subunit delta [Liquorilactobacillus vini]KRM87323.1 DNA-directed RNA polymerase subunit delta [Liquorilactobacillus vini DSM 20605]